MRATLNPLMDLAPDEVPLTEAPLVRVIAQVRFPLITSIGDSGFIAPFQEAIRQTYPVLRLEHTQGVVIGALGQIAPGVSTVWRFTDMKGHWRVSLAQDFVAIETERYTSRDDLLRRLDVILEALREHVKPARVDRVGVRYINRLVGDDLVRLPELLRPEVAGIIGTPMSEFAVHAITENVFRMPDGAGSILARWGLLPPGGTTDPAAVTPIEQASWVLDLDAFQSPGYDFEVEPLLAQVRAFSERLYTWFRWAVTDELLRRFGGRP